MFSYDIRIKVEITENCNIPEYLEIKQHTSKIKEEFSRET